MKTIFTALALCLANAVLAQQITGVPDSTKKTYDQLTEILNDWAGLSENCDIKVQKVKIEKADAIKFTLASSENNSQVQASVTIQSTDDVFVSTPKVPTATSKSYETVFTFPGGTFTDSYAEDYDRHIILQLDHARGIPTVIRCGQSD